MHLFYIGSDGYLWAADRQTHKMLKYDLDGNFLYSWGSYGDYPGGIAGVLAAFTIGHVVPEDAFWIQSGEFVFIALLGGFAGVPGPMMGAIVFEFIQTYASKYFPLAWQMTLGVIMLVIILYQPGGLWAIYQRAAARVSQKMRGE